MMSSEQAHPASFVSTSKAEQAIHDASTDDFATLLRVAGIDPSTQLRFRDWSGVSFRGSDLRCFDFSGARLRDCDFTYALIHGARFDQAEIQGANLCAAYDWAAHRKNWRRPLHWWNSDASLPPFAVFQDAPFAPELVVIPAGQFTMGSAGGEECRHNDEGPQHEVTIPQRIAVGRYPTTFAEWDFAAADWDTAWPGLGMKDPAQDGGPMTRPVTRVSWKEAQNYAAWLSRRTGQAYRLLSEAEWEYSCRAGSVTRYSFGDDDGGLGDYAWYGENSPRKRPHPVGKKKPNDWGLYDIHGNVDEWVEDLWHANYTEKPNELTANGAAWITGYGDHRVVRGGSWRDREAGCLRSSHRFKYKSNTRRDNIGFRVARTLTY